MATVARRFASPEGTFERPSSRTRDAGRAPVVLMVSGGADSTALLVLAWVLQFRDRGTKPAKNES